MTKSQLRGEILARYKALDPAGKKASDEAIFRQVTALPEFAEAGTIFCYVGTELEIDTMPVIRCAWQAGKRVCVPLCISKGVMEAREIHSGEDLQDGKYGIKEPKAGCAAVGREEIDLVIVPCVTCNREGYRLGYGGGFYDRYLSGQAFSTAVLCRETLMTDAVPLEDHDLPVDIVVNESGVYRR